MSIEATVAGWWTEHIDEEGPRYILAVLPNQPVNRHPPARLCCAQTLCPKGPKTKYKHVTSMGDFFSYTQCVISDFPQFPSAFFQGKADLCGCLCSEILKCCNHRSSSTQTEAAALLYFFMRQNFEFTKGKSIVRSHLQVSEFWNVLITET